MLRCTFLVAEPTPTGAGADLLNKGLPVVQAKGKAELIVADLQAHRNHLSPDLQAGGWRSKSCLRGLLAASEQCCTVNGLA